MNKHVLGLILLVLIALPFSSRADWSSVACPSGISVPSPHKGIALWPAGALVQQMMQVSGDNLRALLKDCPKSVKNKVYRAVIVDYVVPGPPAPASDILEFYIGTLRPPAWKVLSQCASCNCLTASMCFTTKNSYLSVVARPSCASVMYVVGCVCPSALPQIEQALRSALSCQKQCQSCQTPLVTSQTKQADNSSRTILLSNTSTDYYMNLANQLESAGQKTQAIDALRTVLELQPGFPPAVEAIRRLETESNK